METNNMEKFITIFSILLRHMQSFELVCAALQHLYLSYKTKDKVGDKLFTINNLNTIFAIILSYLR